VDENNETEPENVPCNKCGRSDLPLHVNGQCAECGPSAVPESHEVRSWEHMRLQWAQGELDETDTAIMEDDLMTLVQLELGL
jgi:ribosomal protein L37E